MKLLLQTAQGRGGAEARAAVPHPAAGLRPRRLPAPEAAAALLRGGHPRHAPHPALAHQASS